MLDVAPADRCGALVRLNAPTLAITEAVRDGAMCRVTGIARPRPRARIGFEVWLPPAERWSGRYYQMGNGGFAGSISRPTLAAAASRGDVAAATDTGHRSTGFDASWARGRPDLVVDYASRSIKVTSDAARHLTRAYYGRDARWRYFMGCSYGGRQALVAAAHWPADWDGVIAGAPATRWPTRLRGFATIQSAITRPGAWLERSHLDQLVATRDVRPLTAAQRLAVAAIERAGYPLASADAAAWAQWIYNRDTTANTQGAFVAQAPALWSYGKAAALEKLFVVGTLRAFAARGGRVLSYFGTADAVLPPSFAVRDAQAVGARADFYRLFFVPGMDHCQGGTVPHAIGQALSAPAAVDDPAHDVRRALEAWAEMGRAPDRLIAVGSSDFSRQATLIPTPLGRY